MKQLLFTLFSDGTLFQGIAKKRNIAIGQVECRAFPDQETYLKVNTDVTDSVCFIFESLNQPNLKILPILFLVETLRDLGAKKIILIAPYLAYMRQDKRFHPGEAITAIDMAKLLSQYVDGLITVAPHLHRIASLTAIYTIPTLVVPVDQTIAAWITQHVANPVIIGPDRESEQWVAAIAAGAKAPYVMVDKIRHGDRDIEVSIPDVQQVQTCTPVLVDDMISTGVTMIATIKHLQQLHMNPPVCIAIHGLFVDHADDALVEAGAAQVVTCNTITHVSNGIDISASMATYVSTDDF